MWRFFISFFKNTFSILFRILIVSLFKILEYLIYSFSGFFLRYHMATSYFIFAWLMKIRSTSPDSIKNNSWAGKIILFFFMKITIDVTRIYCQRPIFIYFPLHYFLQCLNFISFPFQSSLYNLEIIPRIIDSPILHTLKNIKSLDLLKSICRILIYFVFILKNSAWSLEIWYSLYIYHYICQTFLHNSETLVI
jgi:hypothetical protein